MLQGCGVTETPSLEFVIPGRLASATGGYGYDRRIIAGLAALGWKVTVRPLDASFPRPTAMAMQQAAEVFADLPDGALVLVDGLAGGAMPQVLQQHAARLHLLGLVHHPLAAETGLGPAVVRELLQSERQALAAMRHVIVTSAATRGMLPAYGVDLQRVSIIEPGTERGPLALPRVGGPLRMLCVATLIPRKGHDLLFDALASLKSLQWQLACAGSASSSPGTTLKLRTQLARLGIEDRVTLLGETAPGAVARLYQQADLFVLPTRLEGYGMAVAEALAHGLPVISTTTGAIVDLVGPDAGLLVAPGDLAGLQQALRRVLDQPALLAALRAGAAAARLRLPHWEHAARNMALILAAAGQRSCAGLSAMPGTTTAPGAAS